MLFKRGKIKFPKTKDYICHFSCEEEYNWFLYKETIFIYLSDITSPHFSKAAGTLQWAIRTKNLNEAQKERYLSKLDKIISQFTPSINEIHN